VWRDSAPLSLTITTDVGQLRKDKGEAPPWRQARVEVEGGGAAIPLRVRTRGIWRRKNCELPPLRLNLAGKDVKGTPLEGLDKPKLVMPCRGGADHERYVLQEFQLYRVWAALAPVAHHVRLVRLTIRDTNGGAAAAPQRWGFLFEEGGALAKRVGAKEIETKGTRPGDLDPYAESVFGLFQYMIGNTDWSFSALHNLEIMAKDGTYFPVPYDFDFSGAVEASYATPMPNIGIRSVRQRVYRGYCVPPEPFLEAMRHVGSRRAAIEALYHDDLGKLLPPATVARTLEYFGEFWRLTDDPARGKRETLDACRRV
jgi:hypothetical protein